MTVCLVDGCDRPAKTRGWCSSHYMRWYRYVRPDHLLVGTQGDNIADMVAAGRWRNQHAAGPNNDPAAWPSRRARRGVA